MFLDNAQSQEQKIFNLGSVGRAQKTCPSTKSLLKDDHSTYVRGEKGTKKWYLIGYFIKCPSLSGNSQHHKVLRPHELTYLLGNWWTYASNIGEHCPSVQTANRLSISKTIYHGKSVLTLAEHPVCQRKALSGLGYWTNE